MVDRDSTPAEHYRGLFWLLVHQCRVGPEGRTEEWIERQMEGLGGTEVDRLARYLFATGLLTYGRLEMVEVILDNVPPPSQWGVGGKANYLGSNAIRALLPIPEELKGERGWYSHVRVEGVRTWLHQHRDDLRWDEGRGRFVLESLISR